jgi:16S rRNA (uracil1498-N3)-methyltransferase
MSGIRAAIPGLQAGGRTLSAEASAHLCRVLRLRAGDSFVAFDPDAKTEADAVIDEASNDAARVTVGDLRPASVVAKRPLVLVYALARGDKVDTVVQDATELGATHVVVAQTERSVVKIDDAKRGAKVERWRRIAVEAARQCGRADPPAVDLATTWTGALGIASSVAEVRFLLDPATTAGLAEPLRQTLSTHASIAFAVGPEGGFSQAEVDEARSAGFVPVNVGPFVLRTETVAAAVLGAIRILEGT